jgi:hypothetical protein
VKVFHQSNIGGQSANHEPHQSGVFGGWQIATGMSVVEVRLRFVERAVSDFKEPSEFGGPKPTVPFSGISRRGGARVSNLFAIFDVPPCGSLCGKRKHLTLQFESELPGDEIFDAPRAHTVLLARTDPSCGRTHIPLNS